MQEISVGSYSFAKINTMNIGWQREEGHQPIEKRRKLVGEEKIQRLVGREKMHRILCLLKSMQWKLVG